MKKKITIISCVLFVAAMMMFAQPAMSGKWADTPSGLDVEILYVVQFVIPDPVDPEEPDYDFGLMIVGSNFDNGAEPIVKLMGTPCDILGSESFDDLNQEKTLSAIYIGVIGDSLPFPPSLPPINSPFLNSLVTLQTGSSVHQFDTFNISLFFGSP